MRRFLRTTLVLLLLGLVYLNYRLYYTPKSLSYGSYCINEEVRMQLRYLSKALREDRAAEAMQQLYPEGFLFTNALYGLAWCDLAETMDPESTGYREALRETGFALDEIGSERGRSIFNPYLPSVSYGAFYQGWSSYLLGRNLQLYPAEQRDSAAVRYFRQQCEQISIAIGRNKGPYLESYEGLAWPADNILCLAALALHDRLFEPQYETVRIDWLNRIKAYLDADYQLIPHRFDVARNRPAEGVKGNSQALMLQFLIDIDPDFAREQYGRFRSDFLAYRAGLPGIREFPAGKWGMGDVDSGPVVMGIGGAASIVGIKTAARYGDTAVSLGVRNGVEALLFPWHSDGEKRYLFGRLPVLDAFMAWSNAGSCAPAEAPAGNWRWKFQLISIILFLLLSWGIWKTKNNPGIKNEPV